MTTLNGFYETIPEDGPQVAFLKPSLALPGLRLPFRFLRPDYEGTCGNLKGPGGRVDLTKIGCRQVRVSYRLRFPIERNDIPSAIRGLRRAS